MSAYLANNFVATSTGIETTIYTNSSGYDQMITKLNICNTGSANGTFTLKRNNILYVSAYPVALGFSEDLEQIVLKNGDTLQASSTQSMDLISSMIEIR